MQTVRTPAVAGLFYPADAAELQTQVRGFLNQVRTAGRAAAQGDHRSARRLYLFRPDRGLGLRSPAGGARRLIHRVVLLGPSHRVGFRGIAVSGMEAFATPLGRIAIDREAVEQLEQLPDVGFLEQAHAQEHSLEVHLPFLQEVLGQPSSWCRWWSARPARPKSARCWKRCGAARKP
jgi:predicted class III extradiol MEMO1 family dioxygenase